MTQNSMQSQADGESRRLHCSLCAAWRGGSDEHSQACCASRGCAMHCNCEAKRLDEGAADRQVLSTERADMGGGVRPPVVRLRLWLETEDGMFFGTGRGMLLGAVDRFGSLKKAAEHLGMSYRAAWGKIRKTEKVLGIQLIEQAGSRKGGYILTPGGRLLMEKFGEWFDAVEASAVDKARELFPWSCTCFKEAHADRQWEKE